ncbi:MAG: alpha/beta hydrolase [Pseudonocardia sp.]|nr:alpha/beta hydrolase [Pseudonocardia sp.]
MGCSIGGKITLDLACRASDRLAVIGSSVPKRKAELIATMHRREDPAVSTSDLLGWTAHDLRDALGGVTCPAHLVVGRDDLWLDPDAVRWAAGEIPGARCTVLEGIGHYPMEEIEAFDAVLDGWLRELAASQSDPAEVTR